jgi:hypothetical protein
MLEEKSEVSAAPTNYSTMVAGPDYEAERSYR